MNTERQPVRYNSMDLMKFILSFGVIAAHVIGVEGNPLAQNGLFRLYQLYEVLINLPVPFFFVASGFLMARKFKPRSPSPTDRQQIAGFIRRYVKLFLFSSLAYLPLALLYYVQNQTSPLKAVLYYLRDLVFVGEHYLSWQLWYLLATIYALIVILAAVRLKSKPGTVLAAAILLYILGVGVNWIQGGLSSDCQVVSILKTLLTKSIRDGRILFGTLYIFSGMLLADHRINVRRAALLFVLFAALFYAAAGHEALRKLLIPCYTIPFFALTASIRLKDSPCYAWLRKISTVNYLSHTYVWLFSSMIIYGALRQNVLLWAVTSALCVLLGALHCRFSKRLKPRQ